MNVVRMGFAAAVMSAALLAAGCKSSTPAPANSAAGTNGSPAGTTGTANSGSAPQGQQTTQPNGPPPAPGAAPVTETAAPPPPPVTAPAGTPVVVRITETIDSKTSDVGSGFTGVLERPVGGHEGVVFERGTPVSGEVVASKGKGRFKGAGDLGIVVTEIGHYHVETSEYEKVDKGEGKRTGAAVGGGAGLGAIIGGLAGHGKGAVIGGLAGAGAGTAVAATGRRDVEIPSETVITFRLEKAVSR